jgi:hypothetical protein
LRKFGEKFINISQVEGLFSFSVDQIAGGGFMFNITDSAYKVLQDAVRKEQDGAEKLYVRLTMGIG